MLFDPGIIDVFRDALPGLGDFFLLVSQLGSYVFYVVLLLIGYWTFNKRESIILTYVLIVSVLTNYWLKVIIANERPPSSYWFPGADAPSYSTPSGHSQLSASLYGWFAVRIKTWWMALLAFVLTFLIGISRIYLGDVLLGWGLGILIVICFYRLEKPAREFFSQYKFEHLLLSVFFIGLLMTVIAALLPPPPIPITLILACNLDRSSNSNITFPPCFRLKKILQTNFSFVKIIYKIVYYHCCSAAWRNQTAAPRLSIIQPRWHRWDF